MNIVSNARKTAIAAIAAIGVISAAGVVAPTQAQAGNFAEALIGGLIVGGIVASTQRNYYTPAPVYRTCRSQWETRYNSYGQPYNVKVQYCY